MKNYIEILKKCPLFEGIDPQNLIPMLGCLAAKVEFFDKKYTVFAEGTPARSFGILLRGSAQIVQVDYYGNRSIVAAIREGEIFGESFACAELATMPVSVIANEPCEIMPIDCRHILHTCANQCDFHQRLIFNLMKELATKNIAFHRRIEVTAKRSTSEKLMAYLMLCAKQENSNCFDIPFDPQELADYLEVDRSGLSAEISKLRRNGVIECHKNHFELL